MYTLFLTGGIASGKSTVCRLFEAKGAQVVSLDALGHKVLEEPQVKLELARQFGEDVLEWPEGFEESWIAAGAGVLDVGAAPDDEAGLARLFDPARASTLVEAEAPLEAMCLGTADYAAVNRARLAERAFASPQDTAALNAITHPRILARLGEIVAGPCCMAASVRLCVVEVPLIEGAQDAWALADEVATVACPPEVRRKRAVGRGMRAEDFDERNARQIDDAARARLANTVFTNDDGPEDLASQVERWWRRREEGRWSGPESGPRTVWERIDALAHTK